MLSYCWYILRLDASTNCLHAVHRLAAACIASTHLPPRRFTTVDKCSPPCCLAFAGAAAYIVASSTAATALLELYHRPSGRGQDASAAAFHCCSSSHGMIHALNSESEPCRRPFQPIRQLSAGSRGFHCRPEQLTNGGMHAAAVQAMQGRENDTGIRIMHGASLCSGQTRWLCKLVDSTVPFHSDVMTQFIVCT